MMEKKKKLAEFVQTLLLVLVLCFGWVILWAQLCAVELSLIRSLVSRGDPKRGRSASGS